MTTKEAVLGVLAENIGCDVSGAELASRLGVSRNAVWKAVQALRANGFGISAVPNRGYRLEDEAEALSREEILYRIKAAAADTESVPETVLLCRTDSTNNEAKRRIAAGELSRPLLVCAEEQTAGRGRLGRSFYSPDGTGLYMSLAFYLPGAISDAVTVTGASAVAAAKAIETLSGRHCGIKWVNDIYIDEKKVCGILTEAITGLDGTDGQKIVVGVGVNCTTHSFPAELTRAGSVGHINRSRLAAEITVRLLEYTKNLSSRSWLDEYRERSIVLGREIEYVRDGVTQRATAENIDKAGALVVIENGVRHTLSTGEISIRTI